MEFQKNMEVLLLKEMELAEINYKLRKMLYKAASDSVYKEQHHVYKDIQELILFTSDSLYIEITE